MHYKSITTMAAAFAALSMNPEVTPDVSAWPERHHAYKQTEFQVQMAVDAMNGPDWKADWNDHNQKKWFLVVYSISDTSRPSGRWLALGGVFYDFAYAGVAPRLCFESEEKAMHFWENFQALYDDYYLG